ncbi:MAG: hypothetical protein HS128_14390 [Ideonella sp.]|nr:hypothetical protein [Ideonella sp.]MCC7459644.1 hypothetical protein [Nitrospira sp.]
MRAIIHRNAIVAAVLTVLGGVALAQPVDGAQLRGELAFVEATSAPIDATRSTAAVRAETVAAIAAGTIAHGEANLAAPVFASRESRAAVNAETVAAIRLQLIARGDAPLPASTAREAGQVRLATR